MTSASDLDTRARRALGCRAVARGTRLRGGLLAATAVALAAALPIGASADTAPVAHSARVCKPPEYPGDGYFTSLSVRGVSCSTGRRLALAYYRCRTSSGPGGKCRRRVLRFRCTETRESISTEINGRVRCRRGDRRVTHTYQQNL